jgi:hypothetical protein
MVFPARNILFKINEKPKHTTPSAYKTLAISVLAYRSEAWMIRKIGGEIIGIRN